ncbi:Transposable element Tc1 transposase [Labeo rohita]|uniref:Transposable element Tc1 transposase n=1 Tax=Labeo rohita TaxID=84645 RepID=A0ABQ8MY71_LABRO|nr:Transposable element Tc1 transposase [Labeo rohita]
MAGTKCSHSACEMGRKDRGPLLLFDEWLWNQCGWALTVGTDTFINALFLTSRYISWLWALIKRQTASLCVFVFVTIKLCLTVSIFDISDSAVSKHVNRKLSGRKKCGRKRCTTNQENHSLERLVKQNQFKNLGELHKEWTEAGVKASKATTHRRVKDFGYSCRIPLVKPLLNHRQRQRCLTWAKEKKKLTVAQWSKVLFSDESKFCISFGNQGPRVWRKGGEAHRPSCLKSSVKFPQSDLAPAHTAKSTKSWLNDHGVGVLDWPANSPDLNLIENLWGTVKRKMRNKKPKNADELKATVKETWASIPPQQCHRVIISMPRRIEAVIKAK